MKIIANSRIEKALAARIEKARIAYYRGHPIMTDREFDELEDQLRELNPDHPALQYSGAPVNTKLKVRLPYPMTSLDKLKYGVNDVDGWLKKNPGPYVVSWKIDGVSGQYGRKSKTSRLFTRGRSGATTGGDISFLIPHMKKLPALTSDIYVRGELVMPNSSFNSKWASEFKNPRNMAAGLTNRQRPHPAVADLEFLAYDVMEPRMKPSAAFAKLKSLGFTVAPFKVMQTLTAEKLLTLLKAARANSKYEVDGLVISVDKKTALSTSNPEFTLAFKSDSEDESAQTTVVAVEWNLGRTGFFFPRLIVKPVKIKGVTVTYVSGKSAQFVKDNKLGPGAIINLRRSGDVIPDLREQDVIKGGKVTWPESYVWDGANIKPPQGTPIDNTVRVKQIEHFFVTLGIERLKAATLQKYVDAGYDTPRKILRMTEAQFTNVEGVSRTSRVIYQQIEKLRESGAPLHLLMYASGVFGRALGSRKFGAIIDAVPDILKKGSLSPAVLTKLIDDVPGFDIKQAALFAAGLPKFIKWLEAIALPVAKIKRIKLSGSKLSGMSVLFTGVRDKELETLILQNGGSLATSAKNCTVLLAKDPKADSDKLKTARARGILIMTLDSFRKKYGL